ncbi:unnamed protein product [marine sediment metagenome]|uniref:Uncharacterized protein n=1 Tax=marine sediment metagenome TaxID=412755 RepID=X1NS03_9ZZZZ
MAKLIQEEKRAKTTIEVLEIIKAFLIRRAVKVTASQLVDGTWKVMGYGIAD